MRIDRFNQFMNHASTEGVVFYHAGRMDETMVGSIGALLRRRLKEEGLDGVRSRKVFSTFMEMAQNVLHYAAAENGAEGPAKYGAFSVAQSEHGYQVMCGNFMSTSQVARVRERLEAVQGMGPEQARRAYHRQLTSDEPDPESKGAGLGLLTMAVAARMPIEFTFEEPETPEGNTFLFLKAVI